MSSPQKPATPAFGFLTVVEQSDLGLVGGYLVLNAGGRPLEFHCTAPVKPNRAQEILYGPTLKPFLYGEQIGEALVAKAKTDVLLVFTDQAAVLSVRESTKPPVLMLETNRESHPETLHWFQLDAFRVALSHLHSSDERAVLDVWKVHHPTLDLAEPFDRIREALEEAQKSAKAAA